MKKNTKIFTSISVIILIFFGVFLTLQNKNKANSKTVTFVCNAEKSITATFYPTDDKFVDLKLSDGRNMSILRAISASGARYANPDESFVFWNKGDTAFITEGNPGVETYSKCALPSAIPEQSIVGCYVAHLAKDVFTLSVESEEGKSFEGTLDIKNFEKDSSTGTLKGTYENGILLADYTFLSEEVISVGQVIFKKIGDDFVRGYGKPDDATGTRFVDLSKITYDMSVVYKKVSGEKCPLEASAETGTRINLYFYNPDQDLGPGGAQCSKKGLVAVERVLPKTVTPLKESIELLLRGELSDKERAQGITTEFPLSGVSLKSAVLVQGVVTLTFNDPQNKTSGGSCRVAILWSQIEATAKQFPTVKSVRFMPEELFQP